MFDDPKLNQQNPTQGKTPTSPGGEPDDMFSNTDPAPIGHATPAPPNEPDSPAPKMAPPPDLPGTAAPPPMPAKPVEPPSTPQTLSPEPSMPPAGSTLSDSKDESAIPQPKPSSPEKLGADSKESINVDDILAEVEKAESKVQTPDVGTPSIPPPGTPIPIPPPDEEPKVHLPSDAGEEKPSFLKSKKFIIILSAVFGLAILGGVAWLVINQFFGTAYEPSPVTVPIRKKEPANVSGSQAVETDTEAKDENIDTDRDGVTDKDEQLYGTNPNIADTDKDGLTDYNEINTFGTDPNNPDTDGDGFKDGEEVKNNYDPKEAGKKLLKIPR